MGSFGQHQVPTPDLFFLPRPLVVSELAGFLVELIAIEQESVVCFATPQPLSHFWSLDQFRRKQQV